MEHINLGTKTLLTDITDMGNLHAQLISSTTNVAQGLIDHCYHCGIELTPDECVKAITHLADFQEVHREFYFDVS